MLKYNFCLDSMRKKSESGFTVWTNIKTSYRQSNFQKSHCLTCMNLHSVLVYTRKYFINGFKKFLTLCENFTFIYAL